MLTYDLKNDFILYCLRVSVECASSSRIMFCDSGFVEIFIWFAYFCSSSCAWFHNVNSQAFGIGAAVPTTCVVAHQIFAFHVRLCTSCVLKAILQCQITIFIMFFQSLDSEVLNLFSIEMLMSFPQVAFKDVVLCLFVAQCVSACTLSLHWYIGLMGIDQVLILFMMALAFEVHAQAIFAVIKHGFYIHPKYESYHVTAWQHEKLIWQHVSLN